MWAASGGVGGSARPGRAGPTRRGGGREPGGPRGTRSQQWLAFIVRRLLILPILLVGVTILIFLMLSLLTPYERASLYVQDIPKRQGAWRALS